MPNRILREGILSSERINSLSPGAELFYRRVMSIVDDFGRIEAQMQLLRAKCYPLQLDRVTVDDIGAWLSECSSAADSLITLYTVNGKKYLQLNNFGQRKRASKCPSPQDADTRGHLPADDGGGHLRADDGGTPQSAAYARASNPTPTTPPHSNGFSEERTTTPEVSVVPAEEFFEPQLFEEIMGLFLAFGRGAGITDMVRCENAWKGLTRAERQRAHEYAMRQRADWQTRPTGKIAQPWNYLTEKHWERDAPRLLVQTRGPTKAEAAHEEAGRKFREMQR